MANQGVKLATKEEESYRGRVNHLSQASHVPGVMRHNGKSRVKNLEGLTYLIRCEVTWFMKKDFCLITGLCYYESYDLEVEPFNIRPLTKYFPQKLGFIEDSSKGMKGKGKVKTTPKKATKKVTVTCVELERAFKESEDEDDALKIGLVYFTNGVWAFKKIAQLEKPLWYCKMADLAAILRILLWSATNKQPIQEEV
ncbi:unnamed protein product [Malus baccata var. baccata]